MINDFNTGYDTGKDSPHYCGYNDALHNKLPKPHMINYGEKVDLTSPDLIKQYLEGFNECKERYSDYEEYLDEGELICQLEYMYGPER